METRVVVTKRNTQRMERSARTRVGVTVLLILISFAAAAGQAGGDFSCLAQRETIYIHGDDGFTSDNGVVTGCGTAENPYLIEGWQIVAHRADFGINVEHTSRHFVVRNCIVVGGSGAAVHFGTVSNGAIEGCQLLRSDCGVLLENSCCNLIAGNLIAENRNGAVMAFGSRDNVFTMNGFVSNGHPGYDVQGKNHWYWCQAGNYWSDYEGADCDGNGIGDSTYRRLDDRFPLMGSPLPCAVPGPSVAPDLCVTGFPPSATCEEVCRTPCQPVCGPALVCDPIVKTCADQVLTCSRTEVILTADVVLSRPSCSPCNVTWTKAGVGVVGTDPCVTVREPGTYTVTVTGADGCSVSNSVVVSEDTGPPVVAVEVSGMLSCAAPQVELVAHVSGGCAPYGVEWTKVGVGAIGCGCRVTVDEPGTYTVTVTGANGCQASGSVAVIQDVETPVVNAVVGGSLSCAVTEASLSATISGGRPPYSIAWSKPGVDLVASAASITVGEAGTYTVTVTGANGCSASDSVTVTEDVEPPVVDAAVDRVLTCSATEATLTATVSGGEPPYTIEWTTPDRGPVGSTLSITVAQAGTYTVTVTGANGCQARDSVAVAQDIEPPTVDAGPDQVITLERPEVRLTAVITGCDGPCSISWEDMLGDVVGQTESLRVRRPGTYRVTVVRTTTGCSASDDVTVDSDTVSEVMLESSIEGLAVFGQLTLDGVPIADSVFYFHVGETQSADEEAAVTTVSFADPQGQGFEANGAEINYIIPGNSIVTFQIHQDQFIAGKRYWLLHLPTDPEGTAAVAFF
jgi:hypothetical protein